MANTQSNDKQNSGKQGFASMDPAKQKDIASQGGQASRSGSSSEQSGQNSQSGSQGGSPEQHAQAGSQSHKNQQ